MKDIKQRENSLWSRMSYGFADIYGGGAFVVISTFYTVFLTKALGMPTALAGTIPLIGKIWDAITDPIMGNICDRTRSRFGAKRFFILVGSIVSAITFVLMWISIGSGSSMTAKYIFYMLMYMLFSTGYTISAAAILPAVTHVANTPISAVAAIMPVLAFKSFPAGRTALNASGSLRGSRARSSRRPSLRPRPKAGRLPT